MTSVRHATALATLAATNIAVATIDKDMPGHDGTWLVEQIQTLHPAVAMLLATGDDQIPSRVSLSRGVQRYLVKPFSRDLVVQAVKDAVVWHQMAARQSKEPTGASDPIDAWLQEKAGGRPKSDS